MLGSPTTMEWKLSLLFPSAKLDTAPFIPQHLVQKLDVLAQVKCRTLHCCNVESKGFDRWTLWILSWAKGQAVVTSNSTTAKRKSGSKESSDWNWGMCLTYLNTISKQLQCKSLYPNYETAFPAPLRWDVRNVSEAAECRNAFFSSALFSGH